MNLMRPRFPMLAQKSAHSLAEGVVHAQVYQGPGVERVGDLRRAIEGVGKRRSKGEVGRVLDYGRGPNRLRQRNAAWILA